MMESTARMNQCPVPVKSGECEILVGTSGYSYKEWVDSGFYPPATKSADMLSVYAGLFQIVELNYTWYQMARAEALSRMAANVPSHFLFAAKLTRTLTHERDENWYEQVRLYKAGIRGLGKRLAVILIQLPPDFDRSRENRIYLAGLLDELNRFPVAVEFRHSSWAVDSVFSELSRRKVTLVSVDEPELPGLFPPLSVVTNPDLFYVRFHGRNTVGWRTGNMQKKFDYSYSLAEMSDWYTTRIEKMAVGASKGIIFFNNHVRAQAPGNALQMMRIINNIPDK